MTSRVVHLYLRPVLLGLAVFFCAASFADQDTQLRLQQRNEAGAQQKELSFIEDELEKERRASSTTSDPQPGNNINELGRALYAAVQQKHWQQVRQVLPTYVALPGMDPMLVHYARGALARVDGNLNAAEREYATLLALQPDFLPARLEQARVLFESKKNAESLALFEQILASLPPNDERAQGVRNTVASFAGALHYRDAWQGSFAIGPSYNDNMNQSSESYTCLLRHSSGLCLVERSTPRAETAVGFDFDGTLNKRISLSGHHGLVFNNLAYGSNYKDHSQYNEQTLITSLGYSYQNAGNEVSVLPQFKYHAYGNDTLYVSAGLKLGWFHHLNAQTAFRFEAQTEQLDYRPRAFDYLSGRQSAVYATLWHKLPNRWLLFGGLDYTHRDNDQKVHAYQLYGTRIGVSKQWDWGLDSAVFASFRKRRFADYSALLDARREDDEQSYTLTLGLPGLTLAGFSPVFTLRHHRVDSNVDWVYSHEKNQYSLKLEKRF